MLLNGLSRFTAEFKSVSGGRTVYVKGGIRGNMIKQQVLTVADWIEKTDTTKGVGQFVKNGTIFPAMRQIWGEVMNKTPQEAYFALQGKLEEKKASEKLTVLGLSFPQNLVLIGCPLIMLLFMLYYHSHLVIVLEQLSTNSSEETGVVFPWVGLYDGMINRLLTIFSSWLLPCISIIALFVRLWTPGDFSFWIAFLCGVGVVIITPLIYYTTRKIKKAYVGH